ncbi:hypothetical protein QQY24_06150 [Streptomyces sp. TG1A-8]|uniref:hypothetical protein n=1 Tax=Streptomyces sp. TG1A-8 TaxID=3051385 RepID=UPI00265C0D96|nr:hypothetical protein [Streptomyces sp. TG1A-8]MDO0925017.1 hypothetical protein [Streptomyces sp. TG1A-8]
MSTPGNGLPALAYLGLSSGSGKSVLSYATLRALHDRGVRAAPFKAVSVLERHEDETAVHQHCRAARVRYHSDMNPLVLHLTDEHTGLLRLHGDPLGTVRRLGSDTVWLPDLSTESRQVATTEIQDAARRVARSCDFTVVEGSGGVADVPEDVANTTAVEVLEAGVVVAANAQRTGHAAGLAGIANVLGPRIRLLGCVLTNIPDAFAGPEILHPVTGPGFPRGLGFLPHVRAWQTEPGSEDALRILAAQAAGAVDAVLASCADSAPTMDGVGPR